MIIWSGSRGAGANPSWHLVRGGVHYSPACRDKQPFTPMTNLKSPINLTPVCMFLDWSRRKSPAKLGFKPRTLLWGNIAGLQPALFGCDRSSVWHMVHVMCQMVMLRYRTPTLLSNRPKKYLNSLFMSLWALLCFLINSEHWIYFFVLFSQESGLYQISCWLCAAGMTCQARTSYTEDEVLWGHRFESCISLEKGAFRVDCSAFDKIFEVQMSNLSAKDRSSAKEQDALF